MRERMHAAPTRGASFFGADAGRPSAGPPAANGGRLLFGCCSSLRRPRRAWSA